MNKQLKFIILILLVILPGLRSAFAQATFASEDELKQQALKLFEDDEFEEAYPLYSQLASLYPKDPNYNYRLGVCMLYASDDKEKAIPFLEFASTKPDVEKEVIFYLAKAYHLNYRFDDAIAKYRAYAKVASESKANKLQVDHQIEMCTSGKKLLRNITDLIVIDKKELSRTDFYRAYDISDIGGKLLAKPDEESFRTPLDKKKKEKSIIYLATNNNQVYFSSYGDDQEHGKDIYVIRKLPTGEWSKPQTLGYPVNTEYDEDYPFLHPNGKVLYFCSKGHNSMGGYDIFKTTLNEETNTWNKPVNLDFPINTPDDDILYVTNEDEKEAYFSSARSSKTGKTAVFHINVERRPIDVAIVKGMVVKTKDEQALDVKITVKDLADNTILGIYNAKETGSYLINLPNGGRFMYTVEAAGFNTQSEIVLLPTQYEFKPLKQEISYEKGTDKLIIKNLFDEPVDDQSYLLALNFIKEKSRLEAGVDAANAAAAAKNNSATDENSAASNNTNSTKDANAANNISADNENKAAGNKSNTTGTGLSNDAIVKIAYDDAKETETEAKDLKEQADVALNLANQKNELAQNKTQEAAQLMSDANSMTDNVKKQTAIDEANQARTESEELNQETVAAFNIAKKLQLKAAAKNEEADLALQYAKDLDAAVKSKNPAEALEKLKVQEQKLEDLSEKNGTAEPDNIYAGLKLDAETKKRELDKAVQTSADIKQEIADNETLIGTLRADADKTKKEDLKQGLLDQIEGLKADNEQSRKDLEANDMKVARLSKEFNGIKNEMDLVSNVVDKAKSGTNADAAASVASIDKSKLEQQVNEIRKNIDETDAGANTISKNNTVNAASENQNPEKNNGNNTSADLAKNSSGNNNSNKNADNGNKTSENGNQSTNTENNANAVALNNEGQKNAQTNKENTTDNKITTNESSENSDNLAGNNIASGNSDYSKQYSDQLASAEKLSDPLAKETKKAEVYSNWVASINEDLGNKQDALKTEKDKTKKKELTAAIANLENELKLKQAEEKTAIASTETVKSQTATSNSISENSNQASANQSEAQPDNAALATSSVGAINQAFTDRLASADNIQDPAERESKKSEIYKDWSVVLNENIEKQKQDFVASTDPEMKALLAKTISNTETLVKEKKDQSLASADKAATIKKQQSGIASNTSENKSGTQNNSENSENKNLSNENKSASKNGNNSKTTENIIADNTVSMNKSADNSSNVTSSDENKTALNTNAGNNNAVNTNAGNNNTSNSNESATAVSGSNNSNGTSPADKLTNDIASATSATNERERELKKEEAYSNYVSAINEQIASKQNEFKLEKNESRKSALAKEITALQSDVIEKQKLADEAQAKIKSIDSNATLVKSNTNNSENSNDNNSQNNTVTESVPSDKTNENKAPSGNFSTISKATADIINNTSSLSADKMTYTDPVAAEKASSAAAEKSVAENLIAQADDLKIQASETSNQSEKDALFTKAYELTAQAETRKITSEQLQSDAGKSEFLANKNVLDQLSSASVNNKSDDVAMAEMLKDESNIYFDKAQKSRELAATFTGNVDKLTALEDANANEKIALDKQRKATEIYEKANPGFVVKKSLTAGSNTADQLAANAGTDKAATTDVTAKANETKNPPDRKASQEDGLANKDNSNNAINKNNTNDLAINETQNNNAESISGNDQIKTADNVKSADNSTDENTENKSVATSDTNKANENAVNTDNSIKNAAETNSNKTNDLSVNENSENANTSGNDQNKSTEVAITGADKSTENGNVNKSVNENSSAINDAAKNTTSVTPATNLTQVVLAPTEKFERTPQAVYSASRPIPVNEKLPEGLIYKVQIGAFRNPISPEQFNGMSPITAETTTQGFTRYTAGLFTKFSTADQVKNEIRQLGYKDAFVVVFLNGKRISVAEALKMQGENPDLALNNNAANSNAAESKNINPAASNNTNTNQGNVNKNNAQTNSGTIAKAENIEQLGGLFYTVQVGVYSQPVSSSKLYNIQPLYSENLPDGKIKYNSGIYNNVPRAMEARAIIAGAGVKDAFVTAYYQGKRISLPEAKLLEAQGSSVFVNDPNINKLPVLSKNRNSITNSEITPAGNIVPENNQVNKQPDNNNSNNEQSPGTALQKTIDQNSTTVPETGVVFKVQIGAFKDEVPLQIANQFIRIANKGIKNYKDENGLTIYTLGSFKTYNEASQLKSEISSIVTDAFIVAYKDGKKVSIDEAKTLENK